MKYQPYMTVFTPAYNRAHTLPRLYESLKNQTADSFEWIVINDGSTDGTEELLEKWSGEDNRFDFSYLTVENGGKPRAINRGVTMARGKYFFLVDSDDYLTPDAVEKMTAWAKETENDPAFIGVGAARGTPDGKYLKGTPPKVGANGYVDATNLERAKYDLDADMCEAYRLDIYRKYPYFTYDGEKFAPEQITMNEIALDGYRLRWHSDIIYICEYLEDGLTKGSSALEKKNPMGYAAMYNHMLKYGYGFRRRFMIAAQMTALSLYAGHPGYLKETNSLPATVLSFPVGALLAIRRRRQFSKI